MHTFSSRDAQNQFGDVLMKAQQAPVCIERYNKAAAYVLSPDEFEAFKDFKQQQNEKKLAALQDAIQEGLDSGDPKVFDKEEFKARMLESLKNE